MANLPSDDQGSAIQALKPGVATTVTNGGSAATDAHGVYRLSATTDAYYIIQTDAVTVTAANGNFLKAGAYEYVPVSKGEKLYVDSAGSIQFGLCS